MHNAPSVRLRFQGWLSPCQPQFDVRRHSVWAMSIDIRYSAAGLDRPNCQEPACRGPLGEYQRSQRSTSHRNRSGISKTGWKPSNQGKKVDRTTSKSPEHLEVPWTLARALAANGHRRNLRISVCIAPSRERQANRHLVHGTISGITQPLGQTGIPGCPHSIAPDSQVNPFDYLTRVPLSVRFSTQSCQIPNRSITSVPGRQFATC